jgi:hypothetical protein
MEAKKESTKNGKAEEHNVTYETLKIKFKGIDRATFDFDEEFKNGYTPEEAKSESLKRIREWWGK